MVMAALLFLDLENRQEEAWEEGAVRYNLMLKELEDALGSYVKLVEIFNRRASLQAFLFCHVLIRLSWCI